MYRWRRVELLRGYGVNNPERIFAKIKGLLSKVSLLKTIYFHGFSGGSKRNLIKDICPASFYPWPG